MLLLFNLPFLTTTTAQDIHFSQFHNTPLNLSPGLTGVFNGDLRFTGAYRSQWAAALVPYKTYQGTFDMKIFNPRNEKGFFSAGLIMNFDDAGDSNLQTAHIGLSGSYTLAIDKENFLTFGVQGGVTQRAFDTEDLTFDNNWNGDIFDPNRPTNEFFNDTDILYPDFSAGLNWHGQKLNNRTRLDVGGAVYHFHRPRQNYHSNDKSKLDSRWSLYLLPTLQIAPKADLLVFGTAQLQGKYLEALGGLAGKFYLSTKRSKELALQFGFSYRFNEFGDAMIPTAGIYYKYWNVGFTYDVNVSGFNVATNRNGGPEVTLVYTIHKVRPLRFFKACPLI